jgi:nitrite reductase (NO-forming)
VKTWDDRAAIVSPPRRETELGSQSREVLVIKQPTRSILVLAAVAIAALAVVQLSAARPERQSTAAATTIQVRGGEFFFRLSAKSIKKPGKVTVVFKNVGHVQHDLKINGKRTPLISPGRTARLIVTFRKKGRFPYLCTVPGHAQAGMKGTFTVR